MRRTAGIWPAWPQTPAAPAAVVASEEHEHPAACWVVCWGDRWHTGEILLCHPVIMRVV